MISGQIDPGAPGFLCAFIGYYFKMCVAFVAVLATNMRATARLATTMGLQ
jgi:hypothetical protein